MGSKNAIPKCLRVNIEVEVRRKKLRDSEIG